MAYIPNDERREQIIAAALKVIREHGLAQATTRRIAEAANAPLGSIHYTFRSKEELLVAVLESLRASAKETASERVSPQMGTLPAAVAILEAWADWLTATSADQLVEYEFYMWAAHQERLKGMPKVFYGGWLQSIKELLLLAARDDEPAYDYDNLARALLALIDGFNLQEQLLGENSLTRLRGLAVSIIRSSIEHGDFNVTDDSAASSKPIRVRVKALSSIRA